MKLRIAGFTGMQPRLNPRLLPQEAAQRAVNCRLEGGDLVPLAQSRLETTLPAPAQSIYRRRNGTWLSWDAVVNAADGPVSSDRTYYTGDGAPKVIDEAGATYALALPAPTGALLISVSSGALEPTTAEVTYYSYTFVTSLGEESQPAPLSNALLCSSLQIISLLGFSVVPTGRGINRLRLYRSQTDATGTTQLYFIEELNVLGFTPPYLHDPAAKPIGSLIPTTNYDPPVDTLTGLVAGPNGMMAAFSGKDLYFCEPYIPHAWPAAYSLAMDFPIVGLASIGTAFVVLTEGTPYLVQGTSPEVMVPTKLDLNLPCVAAKGIVDLGYSVVYPSTEGFVSVSMNGAQMISGQLYSRTDWQSLNPASIVASQHIGRYIFSYQPDTGARGCSILDMSGAAPWLVDTDEPFTATYFQLGAGRLFFLLFGEQIYEWDDLDSAPKTMVWRSRSFHMAGPQNFGAFLMETDTYDGSGEGDVRIYCDGILRHTVTTRNNVERLPSGFMGLRWEVEFQGTIAVTTLNIAHTPTELASA